jgi:hypothetical protein
MKTTIEINEKIARTLNSTFRYTIKFKNYAQIEYSDAIGNCKHCYLDSTTNFLHNIDKENVKKLDEFFNAVTKVTFNINVNNLQLVNNLKKHYQLIVCNEIPTGYGTGFQYHAIFFTNSSTRGNDMYKKRFNSIKIINSKPILTTEIINKILNFTSKTWLRKYLLKLIS